MTTLQFQVVNWEVKDVEEEIEDDDGKIIDIVSQFIISAFGKTRDGKSVCVHTKFNPYFFVKGLVKDVSPLVKKRREIEGEFEYTSAYTTIAPARKKDIWGFRNNQEYDFTKVDFTSFKAMKKWSYKVAKKRQVYESNIPPLLRFYHRTGIQPTGWMEVLLSGDDDDDKLSNCDIEGWCEQWDTMKPLSIEEQAPIVVASFDIECHSESGKFPDFEIQEDKIIQIGCSSQVLGSSKITDKICFVLGKHVPSNGDYTIVSCPTEHLLIEAFRDHLDKIKCDVLTGWNIFGFDLRYLYNRLKHPIRFGRVVDETSTLVEKELSSSALGNNHLFMLPMPGIFVFDLYHHIRKEYKLDSYKLDNVAFHFLNDKKLDVSPHEIFDAWRSQDETQLARIAEYCVKDTYLPLEIITKTCSLINILEMAKATWVPINWLIERGQQIKVFSQISKKARELGFMIPTNPKVPDNQGYQGATVLEPDKGAHWNPVTALDFKSLYPSIMRAHNMCYSTLVMGDMYDNLKDVEYETFTVKGEKYTFAINVPSVLPAILAELAEFRTEAKRGMKKHQGTFLAQVYDGKQLAYKVSMNSVYGFTGVQRGILPCMPIASSVTSQGRQMIDDTKALVEKEFPGSRVRYGDTDSVMVEFKTTREDVIQESWELGERAAKMCTALFKAPNELELEKIYSPFFLFSKKRYAALKYEDPQGKPEIDVKGIQLVRRDNCKLVKSVSKKVLDLLLYHKDIEGASQEVRNAVVDVIEGRVPMDQLIQSKTLRDNYKLQNQPHLTVRNRMKLRNPGSEPKSGERVPYVFINTGEKRNKQYEKAEDPKYAAEHGLQLDKKYYVENQLKKSILPLFELLHDDPDALIFDGIKKQVLLESQGKTSWDSKGNVRRQKTIAEMFAQANSKS